MAFPIDIKYIIETEEELDIKFPPLFKEKMIEENGGEAVTEDDDWNLYPFFDKSDKKRISRTCNHIVLETNEARKWSNFPLSGIAIASNGCGDQLILLPFDNNSQKLSEKIYFWSHETGEIKEVAENIQELIGLNS
ncbi:SMI1/KNR4 family protein [Flavobacterium sp. KACC 22758]|uniref:SMI1/KNR4 family protein n=1 Tax=Flavobacterium sp. KACC 22758 TaxID=3025667 RepID=UPI00236541C7|nr:SMI1/KNR4 family protein [Flavobacterium sp. KACC 22758]WDF60072.1 SMI1/KNR4 family protein [Flavobacterium sp. KACC 22758]